MATSEKVLVVSDKHNEEFSLDENPKLKKLSLLRCTFSNPYIPVKIGNMSNLKILAIAYTNFTDGIPTEIGMLT